MLCDRKIRSLDELATIAATAKSQNMQLAHCHGVFDLLHPGHLRHFDEARGLADLLIVTLTADDCVDKGPGRPVFNQSLRAQSIASLECVDYVGIVEHPTAVEVIRLLRPDYFVKGSEFLPVQNDITGNLQKEKEAVESSGGVLHFTDGIVFSSSNLLNSYFPVLAPQASEFLRGFRQRYSADRIISRIKDLRKLKVAIVGDVIVDEYCYCKALGKASKSATLTANFLSLERYPGGALAVANHVAGFAGEVDLVSHISSDPKDCEFVRTSLKENVRPHLVTGSPGRTIIKRRFVDPFQMQKMFEVIWLENQLVNADEENQLIGQLGDLRSYDAIIVADFGHGNIGPCTVEHLCQHPVFLALNTQTNSANTGFNLVTKYLRADYVCIDEEEVRLAYHDRFSPVAPMLQQIGFSMGAGLVTVTRGAKGSLTWTSESRAVETPVFSDRVVDGVGAGDAYLALTSLCAREHFEPELVGFIGNCAGALAVRTVANRESVEPVPLFRFITTLLK